MSTFERASSYPYQGRHVAGRTSRRVRRRLVVQRLEPRVLLAADSLRISEVVASNRTILRDFHDDASDWIELRNGGPDPVNLQGWHLTDDPESLDKWRFPQPTEIAPGEHLVVFASGRDTPTPDGEFHTNFRLSRGGEYLALVQPDGETVAHDLDFDVPQFTDVSYGLAEVAYTDQLAPIGANAKVLVPADGSLTDTWTGNNYDDSAWMDAATGVGFATVGADQLLPGFTARMIDVNGGNDGRLETASEADRVLRGDFAADDYEIATDITVVVPRINLGGRAGTFPETSPYMDGTNSTRLSDFAIRVAAQVTIPEGQWTIGWGSDAGGILRLEDVAFLETFNEEGAANDGDGELIFDGTRNHEWTRGTFTVGPHGLTTDLEVVFFERNGGDSFELAITAGHSSDDPDDDTWTLLSNGALDWTVETLTNPPIPAIADLVESNIEDQMFNQATSAYVRVPFEVDDPGAINKLLLRMNYDDAFVANVNGVEVARGNFTGDPEWNSVANIIRSDTSTRTIESFDLTDQLELIQAGTNVLAIQGITARSDIGGFLVLPELLSTQQRPAQMAYMANPTPGSPNGLGSVGGLVTTLSRGSRTFADAVAVDISVNVPTATIRYTVDGSIPDETSLLYTGPVELTETTQIRAKAFHPDYVSLPAVSETYFKLAADVHEFTSDLPVMIIDHFTEEPLDPSSNSFVNSAFAVFEPQVNGRTDFSSSPAVDGRSGIHVRGASSRTFTKKAYRLEVWQDGSDDDRNVSLLGMPAESDWVLVAPDTVDRALIRNALVFDLSRQVGRESPRLRFAEVYLNLGDREITQSDYVGIYAIEEEIKRSSERLDIEKLSTNYTTRPLIEGGYILKFDVPTPGEEGFIVEGERIIRGFEHVNLYTQYVEPKEIEIKQQPAQEAYIRNYLDEFADALNSPNFTHPEFGHYSSYIDVPSWVDYHLINELSLSVDSYYRSTYMFKTRDGKLEKGPVWDYDRSFGSADSRDDDPNSWYVDRFVGWWKRLFEDPEFHQTYIDRWQELRKGPFSLVNLNSTIDRLAEPLRESQIRNFERWTTQRPRFRGGDGFRAGELDGTWQGELEHMKAWIAARVEFLDSRFVGKPQLSARGGSATSPHAVDISGPATARLYYTLDGTDPRQPDGSVNPNAVIAGSIATYVDDDSTAKYLIPTGAETETNWQRNDFFDAQWQDGQAAIGFDTGVMDALRTKSGFTVRQVFSNGRLLNLETTDELLAGNNMASETIVDGVSVINYLDAGNDGNFSDNSPFPAGGGDNFALQAVATLVVPEDGIYTFGTNTDDGSRLRIDGEDVVLADGVRRPRDAFGTVFLNAGEHALELVMFQRRSGTEAELFAALGRHESFGSDFRLLGDAIHQPFDSLIQTDVLAQMHDVNTSLYTRIPFNVDSLEDMRRLVLGIQYDDGFTAYLNGVEVTRRKAPEVLKHNSVSTLQRIDALAVKAEEIDLSEFKDVLQLGENVLAIHGLNASSVNADFLLVPKLSAVLVPAIDLDGTTTITARSFDPTFNSDYVADAEVWSGPISEQFIIGGLQPPGLRISEIHYNPAAPTAAEIAAGFTDGDDFEFVEMINTSNQPLNVSTAELKQINGIGVDFNFGQSGVTELAPGQRVVVVADSDAFTLRYGESVAIAGQWSGGRLSNNSELLTLTMGPSTIHEFAYRDDWFPVTDGNGPSLEVIDPANLDLTTWGQNVAWRASRQLGGSPVGFSEKTFGDFNNDSQVNVADVDQLLGEVNGPFHSNMFDLNADGHVTHADLDKLITDILGTRHGDADLDGDVDQRDFDELATNFGTVATSWGQGDFDGDGKVTFRDFVTLSTSFGLKVS